MFWRCVGWDFSVKMLNFGRLNQRNSNNDCKWGSSTRGIEARGEAVLDNRYISGKLWGKSVSCRGQETGARGSHTRSALADGLSKPPVRLGILQLNTSTFT